MSRLFCKVYFYIPYMLLHTRGFLSGCSARPCPVKSTVVVFRRLAYVNTSFIRCQAFYTMYLLVIPNMLRRVQSISTGCCFIRYSDYDASAVSRRLAYVNTSFIRCQGFYTMYLLVILNMLRHVHSVPTVC